MEKPEDPSSILGTSTDALACFPAGQGIFA